MKRLSIGLLMVLMFAFAQGQTYVQLILDASGSMWNKLDDGTYRIVAAKEVLSNFIKGLPTGDLNVGLRVYGSRIAALEQGSCEDSELFVPMSGVDKAALQSTVDDVSATGATPIAYSLTKAAADFPAEATRRLIILVTDGEESCGGDLQAVAAELRKQGFEIDLKIIGFALDDKAQKSFEGLGEFVNADDAEGLAQALEGAVENVVEEEPTPEPIVREAATLKAAETVPAGLPFEIAYEANVQKGDYITIVDPGTPDGQYSRTWKYVSEDFAPIQLSAPITPGQYELRYMDELSSPNQVLARLTITVTEAAFSLQFPAELPGGTPFEVAWTGPNGESDYITIVEAGAPQGVYGDYFYTRDGSPGVLHTPITPGDYEVRYSTDRSGDSGKIFYSQPLKVTPVFIQLRAPSEVKAGEAFEVSWEGPNGRYDYITIVEAGAPPRAYKTFFYTDIGRTGTLYAPETPGQYEIRYTTDRSKDSGKIFHSIPITVK